MNIFEITIQRKYQDRWFVVTEYTKTGELPIRRQGILKLNSLDNFAELGELLLQPRKYGEMLGKALFYEDVRDAFVEALAHFEGSQDNNECLHVLLQIEAEDLRELRWEKLCAPKNWNFLTLNQRTPFSFYIPAIVERRFPPIGRRDLRALVVVASPEGLDKFQLAHFDVGETVTSVKQALGEIPCDVLANVDGAVGLPTPDELMKRLTQQDKYYTLLHIVCHGKLRSDGETALYLAEADNRVKPLDGSTLIERLNNLRHAPHFAFLSTCESASAEAEIAMGGLAQRLVRELGMPAVVAMTEKVSIKTAQALATTFYQQLRNHGNVDLALVEATAGLQGRYDITVPALFSRLGGRPLFSDIGREQLTNEEIKYGLEKLQQLLPERAPILSEELQKHIKTIHDTLGGESGAALKECKEALDEVDCISLEVSDLSFKALALGKEPTPYDARCPFRGLYPFRLEDHEFFCGREELIEELQQKLSESKFLPVLGASGSGKSSVVMAGLIPALQKQEPGLVMAYMTPKEEPLAQLEASLSKVQNQPYVLVVDQFEELFTLCNDKSKRQDFIKKLLALTENQRVILTMRADFWGECAVYPKLKQLMQTSQELIAPMNSAELRQAVEEQAKKVGLRFEVDLLNKILDDLEGEPGAMPLLQHALLELWKRRHGRWILSEEYRATGGVKQAIAKTADDFYDKLPPREQELLRNIFVRLTRLDEKAVQGEKRRDTRQRVELNVLISVSSSYSNVLKYLVKCLADERLVITSVNQATNKEEVEVAHEALIRYWSKLCRWLDEDRSGLLLRQRIEQEAREWSEAGKREDLLLLQGNRLQEALGFLAENSKFSLNEQGQAYVKACEQLQERNRLELEKQRDDAVRGEIVSLAALSQFQMLTNDFLGALFSSVKAGVRLKQTPRLQNTSDIPGLQDKLSLQVLEALQQSVYGVQERNRLEGSTEPVYDVSFSHDGKTIATANGDKTVKVWCIDGKLLKTFAGHSDEVNAVVFNRDSTLIASGSEDQTVKVWRVNDGTLLKTFTGHNANVLGVDFSFDGQVIASASEDGTVKLWSIVNGNLIETIRSHSGVVKAVRFSPDGKILASGGWDQPPWQGKIKLWNIDKLGKIAEIQSFNVDTGYLRSIEFSKNNKTIICSGDSGNVQVLRITDGQKLTDIKAHDDWAMGASISPNGEIVASISTDKTVKFWSIDGRLLKILRGHNDAVYGLAFSPNGSKLATTSADKTIRLWSVEGPFLKSLDGKQGSAHFGISCSPDGKMMASASWDTGVGGWTVKLWSMTTGELLKTLSGYGDTIRTVTFSHDSNLVASASWDGTVKVWAINGKLVTNFTEHGQPVPGMNSEADYRPPVSPSVNGVSFHPSGDFLISAGYDRHIRMWDLAGNQFKVIPDAHPDQIYRICFNPDGNIFATASWDRSIKIWSKEGNLLQTLTGHSNWLYGLSFSPNGKMIVSASLDKTVKLWNVENGNLIHTFIGHNEGIYDVCFSSDGQTIASASLDKSVKLWSVDGNLLKTLTGHDNAVYGVSFSPNGQIVASASWDGSIKLWSAETLDFDNLLEHGRDWLRDYVTHNSNVSESDRRLILDGEF